MDFIEKVKQLILHIGMHRCGSTSLQKHFSKKVRNATYFSYLSCDDNFRSMRKFIEEIRYGNSLFLDVDHYRNAIKKDFSNVKNDKILVSCEGLMGDMYDGYRSFEKTQEILKNVLCEFDLKIILLIRRQSDFLESIYRKMLSRGLYCSLNQFLCFNGEKFDLFSKSVPSSHCRFPVATSNYLSFVNLLYKQFGASNVTVLPCEMFFQDENRFAIHLCRSSGLEIDFSHDSMSKENVSLSLFRLLGKRGTYVFKKEICLFALRSLRIRFKRNGLEKEGIIGWRLRNQIFNYHRNSNALLSSKIGIDLKQFGYF